MINTYRHSPDTGLMFGCSLDHIGLHFRSFIALSFYTVFTFEPGDQGFKESRPQEHHHANNDACHSHHLFPAAIYS